MNSAFYTLHKDLPREGPGEPADVTWALGVAQTPPDARILDAACGPGADSETLAQALPQARIEAVDLHAGFVTEACERLASAVPRVVVRQGEMATVTGSYDLIWCAGAVYFLGVTEALLRWRRALAPNGRIAFSEPAWLQPGAPTELQAFWAEYPEMTDVPGTRARIADAGYGVLGERVLALSAWDSYYDPMVARIAQLRRARVDAALAEVLDDAETEISLVRGSLHFADYVLFVVAPR